MLYRLLIAHDKHKYTTVHSTQHSGTTIIPNEVTRVQKICKKKFQTKNVKNYIKVKGTKT